MTCRVPGHALMFAFSCFRIFVSLIDFLNLPLGLSFDPLLTRLAPWGQPETAEATRDPLRQLLVKFRGWVVRLVGL